MLKYMWVKVILGIIMMLSVSAIVWRINHPFNEAAKVPGLEAQINANNKNNEGLQKSSSEYQKGKTSLDEKGEAQKEEIENEIKTVIVYRDCIVPISGVQLINKSITSRIN